MKVDGYFLLKRDVKFCTIDATLDEALKKLQESGFRCIPVLDKDEKKYVGNIYKVHLLEQKLQHADMSESIEKLVRDKEAFVDKDAPFMDVFFRIKKLPFISVVNKEKELLGILTHKKMFEILEESLGYDEEGDYSITLVSSDYQGALQKVVSIISRYSDIKSLVTLDNKENLYRRIVVSLPGELSMKKVKTIEQKLQRSGFKVVQRIK